MISSWLTVIVLAATASAAARPNIVFILTDDQDIALGGFTPMEKTKRLIAEQGVTFENAFVTTPVCCPSRSSILTGMYIHNHGATNNSLSGGCSSPSWQQEWEPITYGAILHAAGYRTFFSGKYLNEYGYKGAGGTEHVPRGWDWWVGLVGNSIYYNYTLSVNGTAVPKGDAPEDYLTDVIKGYALQFLDQVDVQQPFLMALSTPSAHAPFTPAPRHAGRFSDVSAPRTPNYNIPVNNTKHWLTRLPPAVLPQETIDNIDRVYRNRWETLLAVDELVEEVVARLESLGVLDNTYIVFSSDHGFHFGQFGLTWDKRHPYEFDIRVPLTARGPDIPRNKTLRHPVLSIDIAPTLLDMAGINITDPTMMDGMSFLPLMNEAGDTFDRSFFIEYKGESRLGNTHRADPCYEDRNLILCDLESSCKCFDSKNNTYTCVRNLSNDLDDIYCSFDDDEQFQEFYDMTTDPYQLTNIALLGDTGLTRMYKETLSCFAKQIFLKGSLSECLK